MDKKELRAQIRAKKRAMTSAQVEACSEKLAELFREHPLYKAAKSIYGYMPYNQEVRTIPIMRQAQADGKRVAVPKVYGDTMKFLWLDDLNAVAPVLMPGLAFDPEGHRCGYGGGFYDKFLAAHPNHPTIALCYGFQMFDHLDVDAHDIPVDAVLSADVEAEG